MQRQMILERSKSNVICQLSSILLLTITCILHVYCFIKRKRILEHGKFGTGFGTSKVFITRSKLYSMVGKS